MNLKLSEDLQARLVQYVANTKLTLEMRERNDTIYGEEIMHLMEAILIQSLIERENPDSN